MRTKNFMRLNIQILVVISLLFTNIPSALAQEGDDGDYIGQVSTTATKTLPTPKKGEPGFQPNVSQPLPGGGTATATAQLAWTVSRMDGIAKSSLSSNTFGVYGLCARVAQLYMNGAAQGSSLQICRDRTGGGSVTATKSKVVASVFGKLWRADTEHQFAKTGWGGWNPTLTVQIQL